MMPEHSYPPKQTVYTPTQRDERAQGRHTIPRSVAPAPETLNNRVHRPYMEALIREAINTTQTEPTSTILCEETVRSYSGNLTFQKIIIVLVGTCQNRHHETPA